MTGERVIIGIVVGVTGALAIHDATGGGAWPSGGATRLPALAGAVQGEIDFVTIVVDRSPVKIQYANALAEGLRNRGIEHAVSFLYELPT